MALRGKAKQTDRTEWFREAKFGMFIHWGVYSVLGKGEWIQTVDQIQVDDYEKLPPRFNPTKFDADAWAQLAKRAGMKYMVITTKHHDGFCLWDTDTTDYQVTNTPAQRDVIREVTRAFRKARVRPCYYYSIMDWHHPEYLPRREWETETRPAGNAKLPKYNAYMREQIRELLTRYGKIGMLWYDGGWEHTPEEMESVKMNRMARKLQPDIMINDRARTDEDLVTPEQYIPPTGMRDEAGNLLRWENCITMTTHWWGYDKHEKTFKSVEWLIRSFVDIVSKGGNLLLNIGPKPDGTIQREFVVRLEAMGQWLEKHGEAIYGTTPSPFPRLPYDYRATAKGNRLYYFVFNWPADGVVRVPGLKNTVKKATLLARGAGGQPRGAGDLACEPLACERDGSDWLIRVPKKAPDKVASVIALDLDGEPDVEPLVIRPDARGVISLPASLAYIEAQHGQRARFEIVEGQVRIGNWTNPNDKPYWEFEVAKPGLFKVVARYACAPESKGSRVKLVSGSSEVAFVTKSTGGSDQYRDVALGTLELPAGAAKLQLIAEDIKPGGVMNLLGLTLKPAK